MGRGGEGEGEGDREEEEEMLCCLWPLVSASRVSWRFHDVPSFRFEARGASSKSGMHLFRVGTGGEGVRESEGHYPFSCPCQGWDDIPVQ